jgi:hypothetical protein
MHTATITKADRDALENLWGEAGTWAAATWTHLNIDHFDGRLRYHGIVFGLTPHGKNFGHTQPEGLWPGRITLHPSLLRPRGAAWGSYFSQLGSRFAEDVLLHEMVHVRLVERGEERDDRDGCHNIEPWCAEIVRITPQLGLPTIKAVPVKPRRVNGSVVRQAPDDHLSRADIAHWPHSLRPPGFYDMEGRIRVPI